MIDSHFLFIDPSLELELRQFFADLSSVTARAVPTDCLNT